MSDLTAVLLSVLLIAIIAIAIRWRAALLALLPLLATLNGLAIPLGASSARVYQLVAWAAAPDESRWCPA